MSESVFSCVYLSPRAKEIATFSLITFFCDISPWRWRQQGPPKHWYPIAKGVTTQKNSTSNYSSCN